MTPSELMAARLAIGDTLREKRKKAKLTQGALSKLSGLSRFTIVSMETGAHSFIVDSMIIYENTLNALLHA